MVSRKNIYRLICVGLGLFMALGFAPLQKAPDLPAYFDDFEKYRDNRGIEEAYPVWDNGAVMRVLLGKDPVHSGKQAMEVEIVSPNPHDHSTNGSIYHVLPFLQRDWSRSSGVRFWVNNPSNQPLLLSINFKEEFIEYWAVAPNGLFFLQNKDGSLLQQDISYSNLPVPANYQGLVVIPFFSFTVPDWNTARGNAVMNLGRIESFAIGVNIGNNYPRFFSLDDIEIIAPTDFQILVIQGTNSIQVPTTGQHQEHFSTFLNSPAQKTSKEVSAVWSLKEPYDHMITLDKNGNLTIPAGVQGDRLTLAVTYASATPVYSVSDEFEVVLENGRSSPEKQIAKTIQTDQNKVEYSAYNRFSKAFDAWAYENRPLFVIIIISALFILLVVLAFFQHRLN